MNNTICPDCMQVVEVIRTRPALERIRYHHTPEDSLCAGSYRRVYERDGRALASGEAR